MKKTPLPTIKTCRWCGEEFVLSPIMRNKAYIEYCSRLCADRDAWDYERTESSKDQYSRYY